MFTLVHLSDLHIPNRRSTVDERLEVLSTAVGRAVGALSTPGKCFLVVTGDFVNAPTKKALHNARDFVRNLLTKHDFLDSAFVVPGNHDVKAFFGNLVRVTKPFHKAFSEFRQDAIDDPCGLHLIGVDSTPAEYARGKVTKPEYDRFVNRIYSAREQILPGLRVVAMHHHALPLAEDEHGTELGIEAEPLMYLRAPAQFLHACIAANVQLVIHGHRHVHGLARYSVPRPGGTGWADLYVLSCPSSTGRTAHLDAGFNLVHYDSNLHIMKLQRFVRERNITPYTLKDTHTITTRRVDKALEIRAELLKLGPNPMDHEVHALAAGLFSRRAFTAPQETSWPHFLHRLQVTHRVWEKQVLPLVPAADRKHFAEVAYHLELLKGFVAERVLQMSGFDWDRIKHETGEDEVGFLKLVPRREDATEASQRTRKEHLDALHASLVACGLPVVDFPRDRASNK